MERDAVASTAKPSSLSSPEEQRVKFLNVLPAFVFFTGKGGVGKTSLAYATAIRLADQQQRILLVSTDPASNVEQVFGIRIGHNITAVAAVPNLSALKINPQAAAQAYLVIPC